MAEIKESGYARRRRGAKDFECQCCRQRFPYCFNCPCGFQICAGCFEENKWGLTNGPTWVCPDCGSVRML